MTPPTLTAQRGIDIKSIRATVNAGRFGDALSALNAVIAISPEIEEAWELRAEIEARVHAASRLFESAVTARNAGRTDDAIAAYERATELHPGFAAAWNNLGAALQAVGRSAEAVEPYATAAALGCAAAWVSLGAMRQGAGDLDGAAIAYRSALDLEADNVTALANLGGALIEMDRPAEAETPLRRTLEIDPNSAPALNNLGNALALRRCGDEAIACYERSILIEPNYSDTHTYLGMELLRRGDYRRGWAEYAWRLKTEPAPRRFANAPAWEGSRLPNATLLLYAEQGFGDAIQFVRFAKRARERVGRVVLDCPEQLRRLLSTAPGVDATIASVSGPPDVAFDIQASLMSLPHLLDLGAADLGMETPYLTSACESGHEGIRLLGGRKVGIVWRGSPRHSRDATRCLPLSDLDPLANVDNVTFVSLQVGLSDAERAEAVRMLRLVDPTPSLADFNATAALIDDLDLVISVDTAVAHVAGALGKPVWNLLAYASDWRWGVNGAITPWYPSMRLFRQPQPGDWSNVIAHVCSLLGS